jgi:ribosomal protein S21
MAAAGIRARKSDALPRGGLHFGANLSSGRPNGTSRLCDALFIARISATYGNPDFRRKPRPSDEQETTRRMQIIVRDNNVDQALRALKKKLQREGVYREMKLRRHYEKPSEKRARERAAAVRRARKMERKRMERDGIK